MLFVNVACESITCAFGLYIWCAGADPADAGVFKSRKYCKTPNSQTNARKEGSNHGGESLTKDANDERSKAVKATLSPSCLMVVLCLIPRALTYHCSSLEEESSQHQTSEDGMFYCSLCEVEVFKYSKHCRWLNNCVGKKIYKKFFTLMLILQWSTGIVVLISCAIDHERYKSEVASKLGSNFKLAPYVAVVAVCTILAMIATLPLIQLFFFHLLLIKKGIST
ncbi:probable protein S-acyltransferase 22 isoform X4 [Helianthus annuus]|uniref:probable protein S-acyltransferase 22 isoform X4 n=2 Tax=Helianthus annuus TaxID=4232 RepID=UPI000B8F64E7|nr:probable protein S-acyltransferase 22 isoform X4 [Helianthus annuus]